MEWAGERTTEPKNTEQVIESTNTNEQTRKETVIYFK